MPPRSLTTIQAELSASWHSSGVGQPLGGLNETRPSRFIGDDESPDLLGVEFYKNRISGSHGVETELKVVSGNRPTPIIFRRLDGTREQLILTSSNLYKVTGAGPADVTNLLSGLSGTVSILPSWTQMPNADLLIITNGVDTPIRYDGETAEYITELTDLFTTFTARSCVVWYNFLLFLDTTENGERFPYRIRRSGAAAPATWEGGLAGKTDLLDSAAPILKAQILGNYLMVYREGSIVRGEYVGLSDILFDFNTIIETDGPISASAIVRTRRFHAFRGFYGIYTCCNPGVGITRVSEKLNISGATRTYAIHTPATDSIHFVGGSSIPGTTDDIIMHVDEGDEEGDRITWSRGVIPQVILGVGEWWEAWREIPVLVRNSISMDKFDRAYTPDRPWHYVTRQFGLFDRELRLDRFIIVAHPLSGLILEQRFDQDEYSDPDGAAWVDVTDKLVVDPLNGRIGHYYIQSIGNTMQFRFSGESSVDIMWYGFEARQEGKR